MKKVPIGVFDSGYGGLTVLSELLEKLPSYDYIYFGDNARAPYGNRSFDVVYSYTLEAVDFLFSQGCELIIIFSLPPTRVYASPSMDSASGYRRLHEHETTRVYREGTTHTQSKQRMRPRPVPMLVRRP